MTRATVLDGDRRVTVDATTGDDTLLVTPATLELASGWELRPEGLCRGDVCVPVRDREGLEVDGRIDLRAVGGALGRPVAYEADPPAIVLGDAVAERHEEMARLSAPDFTLPGVDGQPVSLGDYHGRKRMLLAWASW